MKISAHIDEFKQEMARRNYSKNTVENYASCLNLFFNQSKSDHPKNIHEKEIKEFLGTLKEPNTQRNYHSAIKKYFEIVLRQKDKFKYIPYAQKSSKLPIVLSVSEIQRMFDVCENNLLYLYRLLTMKTLKSPIIHIANCYNHSEWVSLCV